MRRDLDGLYQGIKPWRAYIHEWRGPSSKQGPCHVATIFTLKDSHLITLVGKAKIICEDNIFGTTVIHSEFILKAWWSTHMTIKFKDDTNKGQGLHLKGYLMLESHTGPEIHSQLRPEKSREIIPSRHKTDIYWKRRRVSLRTWTCTALHSSRTIQRSNRHMSENACLTIL